VRIIEIAETHARRRARMQARASRSSRTYSSHETLSARVTYISMVCDGVSPMAAL
jgi:hypothetical protein